MLQTLLYVLVFLLVSLPFTAHAGVFSFVSNLFGSQVSATEEPTVNSQNMALLQASLSPVGTIATSTHAVAIINGTSLVAEADLVPGDGERPLGSDQISLYVVHPGDTLPAIAKMFGVTTNTIMWGNDLKDKKLTPGQTLVILPISGVQHTVKSGDTLQGIAKQYKGDLNEILQYNNLSKDSKLAVGDVIIIPDGEVSSPSSSKSTKSSGSSGIAVSVSTGSLPTVSGYYLRPIIGGVKTQGLHGHNGVDLASSFGSDILASAAGTVIVSKNSGWNGGYGDYIVIQHNNGTQTLYGHLSATKVSVGDHVEQGQVIGAMGTTGNSTGVHVHFEIRGAKNPF